MAGERESVCVCVFIYLERGTSVFSVPVQIRYIPFNCFWMRLSCSFSLIVSAFKS